jgi:hypothetical protein
MTIEAIAWALNTAPIPTGRNASTLAFVLVGLANHADPGGSNAFPAAATLSATRACPNARRGAGMPRYRPRRGRA